MAKAVLICGKICCGKSTYAQRLRVERKAAVLSVDEIMLALFGPYAGDRHDEYTDRLQRYLLEKSVELVASGVDVILDWGFWSKAKRSAARAFYKARGIACECHYLDVSDEIWRERIARRNAQVARGEVAAYPIDENLAAKFEGLFESPAADEIDAWVRM